MVVKLERRQKDTAEQKCSCPQKRSFFRQGIGFTEIIDPQPAQNKMEHIMDFESEKKRQDEIKPCAGIKNSVFGIGQEGLPVSVSIRPESKVALFHKLNTQMAGGDFQ